MTKMLHKDIQLGRVNIYFGIRRQFHLEIGIGIWNFDGWDIWIDLLLLYAGINIQGGHDG